MAARHGCPLDLGLIAGVALLATACTATPPPRTAALELDSRTAHPYIQGVKDRIALRLTYPCVRSATTGVCEPLNASVGVDFGILKTGALGFVQIVRPSGQALYDTEAVEAVRRAAPFPPVPADLMATVPAHSTGIPIRANVNFVVKTAP